MAGQKQKGAWCGVCGQQRLFVAPTPSHLLHLVLTIITAGIWLIVWLIIGGKTGPYRCTVCGSKLGAPGAGGPPPAAPPPPPAG